MVSSEACLERGMLRIRLLALGLAGLCPWVGRDVSAMLVATQLSELIDSLLDFVLHNLMMGDCI